MNEALNPTVEGCNISTACNYNPDVTKFDDSCDFTSCMDCLGYPNGVALLDSCGTCDAAPQNDCIKDCSGTWGGTVTMDNCGNCSTSSIACGLDCMGVWGGSAVMDACEVCEGSATSTNDCSVCDSGLTLGCDGICSATPAVNDVCDICGGDGTYCLDCLDVVGGSATTDNCGTCDSDATNDCSQDCDGVWGGSAVPDNCGVCGGDGSNCEGVDCTDNLSSYCQDLSVLQKIINNSQGGENPPPSDMSPIELGGQTWEDGRLVGFCSSKYQDDQSRVSSSCTKDYELSGEIPSEIGQLTNLIWLSLYNNQLTGDIPSTIGNLTNLTSLDLNSNQLTGEIPSEIGNLSNLAVLVLHHNLITGEIPPSIWNLTNLTYLHLGFNDLTGEIPPEIGNLTQLHYINLRSNQLSGDIPSEIGLLTNLSMLFLSGNQLTGNLPSEIGYLSNLSRLHLSSNQLSGYIPYSICQIYPNLDDGHFLISNNQLCPPYPSCLTEEDIGIQDISACPVQD